MYNFVFILSITALIFVEEPSFICYIEEILKQVEYSCPRFCCN
ncbi:unnamed protein product [Larinioides sclopetarius]|uniref:Uncharacterized protein n=1 Tax=Larinioides sclopetarius TaxID=280406 RepID=A0AAV2ALH4_9ARAC